MARHIKELEFGLDTINNIIYISNSITDDTASIFYDKYNLLVANGADRVKLAITSSGGSVTAAYSIIDLIETLPVPIDTMCIGNAYSAAAMILIAGKKRYMTKNSLLVFHRISTDSMGDADDIYSSAKVIKMLEQRNYDLLTKYSKRDRVFWVKNTKKDLHLTSDLALEYGIIDEVI